MNNSAAKVGEIFTEAGAAFNKLAEMTMMLHPLADQHTISQAKTPVKRKQDDRIVPTSNTGSGQVTLNMLNSQETEDGDMLSNNVNIEFESSTEEVVT